MVSVALALVTLAVVRRMRLDPPTAALPADMRAVWRSLPRPLRRLLISDICIRTCDAMVDVFLVLYAVNIVGISAPAFGGLVGVQMATVILCSLPAAQLADRVGRKPFVIATFVAFACFPLAVVAARSLAGLVVAFVVGGLREIGEPARKALILDLVQPEVRARGVGLYICSEARHRARRPHWRLSLEGVTDGAIPVGRRDRWRGPSPVHPDRR